MARGVNILVVMPAYNVAPYIGAAIASVLTQTHAEWRLVIIDDGSTDGTADAARISRDPRIKIIRQDNAGVSAARNRGIDKISADAVLFLDADDWLAPDALRRLAAALAGSEAVAACGAFRFVTEDGAAPGHMAAARPASGDLAEQLVVRNLFANGGHLLIRAGAIAAAGRFATGLRYGEDWEYWCRLALFGRFAAVDGLDPVLFVRQRRTGAYLRMASDPAFFEPCMDAIFANPALQARFGPTRAAALRGLAEAENAWIIGREMIRHGRRSAGRRFLLRSLRGNPSAKRLALLAASLVPGPGIGPFRAYR